MSTPVSTGGVTQLTGAGPSGQPATGSAGSSRDSLGDAAGGDVGLLRIGEAAEQAGVSCRTLRYYEELELLVPAGHSAGGARRYTSEDISRLLRIRELQELLGFDLGEIRSILRAEDQLADLRSEYNSGATLERRKEILAEATHINGRLKETVSAKQARLSEMMRELDDRSKRHRAAARKLDKEASDQVS